MFFPVRFTTSSCARLGTQLSLLTGSEFISVCPLLFFVSLKQIFLFFLSGPCHLSGQLWSVADATTCMEFWLRHFLTVMSLLYGCLWRSLLVSPLFWLIIFMCRILAILCWLTTLERSPIHLCLWCGCVVLSAIGLIDVHYSHWYAPSSLANVRSHCRLAVSPLSILFLWWYLASFVLYYLP